MGSSGANFNSAMGRFQQEVVRWNRQINLVSRKGTPARVAGLIGQCRNAWLALDAAELANWKTGEPVWYFDLGSGGGLPGYVWHQLLSSRFDHLESWLVEPRAKRAWFLERLNAITPERPLRVCNARWCETEAVCDTTPDVGAPAKVLISMKALRLPDPIVLTGLAEAWQAATLPAGGVVAIARFYPPEQRWTSDLVAELEIANDPLVVDGVIYRPIRQEVVSPKSKGAEGASLVLSIYEVSG